MIVDVAGNEKGVEGEGVLLGNLVEHMAGEGEAARFGVEADELRGEEVVGSGGGEDETRVDLLPLAREAAIGAALNEAAVEREIDAIPIV